MESHVSGGTTPLSIGELRQAILAVLVGNPLFTEEEQLLANHLTYECEDAERLAWWLRNVRRQDAKRGYMARNFAALDADLQRICLSEATYVAETQALLRYGSFPAWEKCALSSLMKVGIERPGNRLRWLGNGYLSLLDKMGRIPKAGGFSALLDN